MIVIALRNLAPRKGICNGTRLIVKSATTHLLCCQIARGINYSCHTVIMRLEQFKKLKISYYNLGERAGEQVFIPRIQLTQAEEIGKSSFSWQRRQYPIRPAFAMTCNKSQGQTLGKYNIQQNINYHE